jgi:hypothetical protein
VRIPDQLRVEAVPGRLHELVALQVPRQAREARIPEPLLRPVAPGGEAGKRAGAESC